MENTQTPLGLRFSRARRDELISRRDELQYGSGYFNNRKIPYFEARPLCLEADMCTHCEYALHQTVWPVPQTQNPIGFVDCMMATQDCKVCNFMKKIFFDACPGFPESEVVCKSNRRRFCLWLPGFNSERVTDLQPRNDQWSGDAWVQVQEVSDFDLEEGSFFPYRFKDNVKFRLDIGYHAEFMRLVQGQSEEAAVLNLSREVGELWNAVLFKDVLQVCTTNHGENCEGPVGGFSRHEHLPSVPVETGAELRVIDVSELCIRMLPQGSSYVALSYCWSKGKYTTLTLSNYNALAKPQGLLRANLAPTIVDAIHAAKELAQDYIWIDSLCIIQDDPISKAVELARMDDIYRAALLTIVGAAAHLDGTDPGLPGIKSCQKRGDSAILDIRGLRFRQSAPTLWDALQETRWHSRAWTFQEYLLSKRLLIFMPEQVYWICDEASFAEDYVDHVCTSSAKIEEKSIAPCCELSILETESDGKFGVRPFNYFNDYSSLVSAYTRREMSFNSDAINAARGLLRLLEREHNIPFLCGLPVPHLIGYFLAWCPVGPSRRRDPSSAGDARLPTWSWAGWHGEAVYASTCFPDVLTDDGFDKNGVSVNLDDEIKHWSILLPSESSSAADSAPMGRHEPSSIDVMCIDHCLLEFVADVACFRISGGTYGTPADMHGQHNLYDSMCRQIILNDVQVGALLLHCSTINGTPYFETEKPHSPSFIALSRGDPRWRMWYPINESDPSDFVNWQYEDEDGSCVDRPPFDEGTYSLMGKVVNVLLICTASSGVTYRAGVGQIHADAWDSVERKPSKVVLG
ncbi:hypothetical protein Q7P37_006659 [Cladosporium fusiforme]